MRGRIAARWASGPVDSPTGPCRGQARSMAHDMRSPSDVGTDEVSDAIDELLADDAGGPRRAARSAVRPRPGVGAPPAWSRWAGGAARAPARRRPPGAGGRARPHDGRRRCWCDAGRTDDDRARVRRAVRPPAAAGVHRRGRLVPAVQRAGSGVRHGRPGHVAPNATATSGSSTARRCGRPTPTCRTGRCSSPGPIPSSPSTGGSRTSGSTSPPPASTSGRCAR